jgi:hypothetical protein
MRNFIIILFLKILIISRLQKIGLEMKKKNLRIIEIIFPDNKEKILRLTKNFRRSDKKIESFIKLIFL